MRKLLVILFVNIISNLDVCLYSQVFGTIHLIPGDHKKGKYAYPKILILPTNVVMFFYSLKELSFESLTNHHF